LQKVGDNKSPSRGRKTAKMKLVSMQLPDSWVEELEILVERGLYPSRSEAIRHAIKDLLDEELSSSGRWSMPNRRKTRVSSHHAHR